MPEQILKQIYPLKDYSIIIANGQYPMNRYFHELIIKAQTLICCDGAINNLLLNQIEPNYIIGDCDSINSSIKDQYQSKIITIPDQNSNDLTKAVNLAQQLKLKNLVILGATGMREDHTLANIGLLTSYAKQIEQICLISDYGIFTVHEGIEIVKCIKAQQISFFTNHPNQQISVAELKWPLTNYHFEHRFSGTLNEATHDYLTVQSTEPIILFRAFEIRSQT